MGTKIRIEIEFMYIRTYVREEKLNELDYRLRDFLIKTAGYQKQRTIAGGAERLIYDDFTFSVEVCEEELVSPFVLLRRIDLIAGFRHFPQ